jgi:transposase-like protein
MVANRKYNRAFKLGICESIVLGNKSKAQTCREHGLTPSMLDRWVNQYKKLGIDSFPNSAGPGEVYSAERTRELEALVGRLMLENQILKSVLEKGGLRSESESG